jgi:hypothetical protein
MKKTLLTMALVAAAASAFAQGGIAWGNNPSGFRAHIFGPDPGDSTLSKTGQTAAGIPAGSTTYAGALLTGTSFSFTFWAGSASTTSNNLQLLASTTFRTGTAAGLVNGGTVTVPGVNAGDTAHFQIRVWNNQGGTITTWAAAEAAWLTGLTTAGVSPVVTSAALGGTDTNGNPVVNPVDSGWTSFNIYGVPEPTTFALLGLGAAGLMIFRRRK